MPPTIQTNVNPGEQRPPRAGERRSELVCRVKYCNTLPDLPFDPKFITYPFESTRFIQYNPTSLERNYKYEVLTEHDLGVTIDLINRDTYATDFNNYHLDPADEKLLEEDILTQQDSKRSRHHAQSVSWLRRTEYISTEQTRFQPQTMDKVEAKVGFSIKKNFKDETLYMDRDSQIKAIEKTFKDTKIPIDKHYSKPNVVAVEVQDIFPDFKIWKYPCAQVIFDSDPAPTGRPVPAQIEEMSQAMIRGVMDESGEQFVAYFLPTDATLEKRRSDFTNNIEYTEEEEYEYKMAREYNWNVKSKASKGYEENYFLVMRPDGVYFNELETRVRLSKRRQKAGQQANNTRLVVRHRPLNAQEFKMQRYREKQLEPPNEEEEEEEEDEEEEQGGLDTVQQNKSDGENEDKEGGKGERSRSGSERDGSDKEGSEGEKSDKEESDREKSDKDESDKEKSDKEGSDQEGSDREDSTKADSGKEDEGDEEKETKSRSGSEKGESDKEDERSGSEDETKNQERNDAASASSGSRSSSRSRSKSRSRSRSASRSKSRSGSPAGSRSPTRSRSGSASGSGSSSASNSGSDSDDDK